LLDDLLLATVVNDLEVLLLDLDDLLLLVEVVEAIGEVEAVALEAVENSTIEAITKDVVLALGDGGRDGLCGCGVLLVSSSKLKKWRKDLPAMVARARVAKYLRDIL
jgi:hypothetical protein